MDKAPSKNDREEDRVRYWTVYHRLRPKVHSVAAAAAGGPELLTATVENVAASVMCVGLLLARGLCVGCDARTKAGFACPSASKRAYFFGPRGALEAVWPAFAPEDRMVASVVLAAVVRRLWHIPIGLSVAAFGELRYQTTAALSTPLSDAAIVLQATTDLIQELTDEGIIVQRPGSDDLHAPKDEPHQEP